MNCEVGLLALGWHACVLAMANKEPGAEHTAGWVLGVAANSPPPRAPGPGTGGPGRPGTGIQQKIGGLLLQYVSPARRIRAVWHPECGRSAHHVSKPARAPQQAMPTGRTSLLCYALHIIKSVLLKIPVFLVLSLIAYDWLGLFIHHPPVLPRETHALATTLLFTAGTCSTSNSVVRTWQAGRLVHWTASWYWSIFLASY